MSKNDYETIKVFRETKTNAKIASAQLGISMAQFIDTAVTEKINRDRLTIYAIGISDNDTAVTLDE